MALPPMHEYSDTILQSINIPHVEIEFRIGKKNRNMFDSNVGEKLFQTVKRRLERFTGWDKVSKTEDEVYYWNNNVRCVYNEHTGTSVCVKKEKKAVHDIPKSPLDIRLSISTETPVKQPDDEATRNVIRKRTSFIRKNVSIDLTEIHGNTGDIDEEQKVMYQIEIEIIDPKKLQSIFDVYTAIWKITNVLNICV